MFDVLSTIITAIFIVVLALSTVLLWKETKDLRNFALVSLINLVSMVAALAEGAVAVGISPRGVIHGYAVGHSFGYKTEEEARQHAIEACKKSPGANAEAIARCEVVATFHNQCFSSAIDPKNGTPGAGWAVADTLQKADAEALARCRNTTGDRRDYCKLGELKHDPEHDCDGTAK